MARWLRWLTVAVASFIGMTVALQFCSRSHNLPRTLETLKCPSLIAGLDIAWALPGTSSRWIEMLEVTMVVLGNAAIYGAITHLVCRRLLGINRRLQYPAFVAAVYWLAVVVIFDCSETVSPLYLTVTLPWSHRVAGESMSLGMVGLLFALCNAVILYGLFTGAHALARYLDCP